MKKTFLYPLLTILLVSISCNQLSKEEQEFDALMQKVIDVHDEVMPKMGEMSTLIKDLEVKIDTTAQGQTYAKAQQGVKDAYDFMMTWMSDFSTKFPHEEGGNKINPEKLAIQMKLLKEEKVKVDQLKEQINSSIKIAKEALKKP
ncbi:hypothetical protein ABW636_07520 [Aquimarina sp. 2201CG1-2-11]|uniref:hypothetical protein n=1 Tax=Aquimarina discodermiae TaxID=3231043 RepID=UPI003462448E